MKIVDISEITTHAVEDDDGTFYERRGEDNWFEWMGNSLEEIVGTTRAYELEQAFQEATK
jgi:hypothetical protein